jgi:hypothetical protein
VKDKVPSLYIARATQLASGSKALRSMSPRHAHCVVALVLTLLSGCASLKPVDQSIFTVLTGTWGWEQGVEFGCGGNSHAISFTPDRRVMLLKYEEASIEQDIPANAVRYRVLQSEPNLRMVIEGEKRMTSAGEPVMWDVRMLTADRFCWHRTDWPQEACTTDVVRCPVTKGIK